MRVYHVGRDGVEIAQLSEEDLHKLAGESFFATDLVWTIGMPNWISVETFLNSRRHLKEKYNKKRRPGDSLISVEVGKRAAPKSYVAQQVLQSKVFSPGNSKFRWLKTRWVKVIFFSVSVTTVAFCAYLFEDIIIDSLSRFQIFKSASQNFDKTIGTIKKKISGSVDWSDSSKIVVHNECIRLLHNFHEDIANVDTKKAICGCVVSRVSGSVPSKVYEELRRTTDHPSLSFLNECISEVNDEKN